MPRRSREQVLNEFHYLYDCFEAALVSAAQIEDFFDASEYREFVLSRGDMLILVSEGKATATQICTGTKAALGDIKQGLKDLQRRRPPAYDLFQKTYRNLRDISFADDISLTIHVG
ncbi:hypothetical protein [Roseobacter sp. SK209-2-6]|uniref:hypothetical protein n=1 Tax=Roseobacter sp. SK209-2-6 TaxID=388739 RepID=UPI0002F9C2DC|nr:hypothetical protein [Roseobacter sp. SK209-2-6]